MQPEFIFNLMLLVIFLLGVFLALFPQGFTKWEHGKFNNQISFIESLPNYFFKNSHLLRLKMMNSTTETRFTIWFYRVLGIFLILVALFFYLYFP